MPANGIRPKAKSEILTFEELIRLVKIFASLGITKVRVTGGEPLVRKDVDKLIKSIKDIEGINEILLTTNGTFLAQYADKLKIAGVNRINISLDTLDGNKFRQIARGGDIKNVLRGIDKAIETGFDSVKINVVVMKTVNDDEILDFIDFGFVKRIVIRFIEFMKVTPMWDNSYFLPIEEVKEKCEGKYNLLPLEKCVSGPAHYYMAEGRPSATRGTPTDRGKIGFIKTTTENCHKCSRLRLTSTGSLKLCLYEKDGFSLRDLMRAGMSDDDIRYMLAEKIGLKKNITYKDYKYHNVYMSTVGG